MKQKVFNSNRFSAVLFFTFVFLLAFPSLTFSQEVTFSYDSEAVPNKALNNTVSEGYFISFNYKFPYVYFKNVDNHRINYATYNYEKQFWVQYNYLFDPGKINLESLFTSIDLSKTELNRDKEGNPVNSSGKTVAETPSPAPVTKPGPQPELPEKPAPEYTKPTAEKADSLNPWGNSETGSVAGKQAYSGNRISESRKEALHNYAEKASVYNERNVSRLASYLEKPCRNNYEKAWIIYCWAAENITYDTVSFFAGKRPPQDADTVLGKRSAVCAGYANLYESLGEKMGLEVAVISGHGKGFGYHKGLAIHQNHAWTGIKLSEGWILADATWGAGYINESRVYVPRFDESWFDVSPDQMVFSHLPADLSYLLTNYLWSTEEYSALPKLRPEDFSEVFTPEFVLRQRERYGADDYIQLMPLLTRFIEAGISGEEFFKLSAIYTPEELEDIHYSLTWTLKSGFSFNDYYKVVSADKSTPTVRLNSCPTVRGMGIKIIDCPIEKELELGKTYTFVYSAENALDYSVIDADRQWYYLTPEGKMGVNSYRKYVGTVSEDDIVSITFRCTRAGNLTLMAKPINGKGYYKVLIYTVKDFTGKGRAKIL